MDRVIHFYFSVAGFVQHLFLKLKALLLLYFTLMVELCLSITKILITASNTYQVEKNIHLTLIENQKKNFAKSLKQYARKKSFRKIRM